MRFACWITKAKNTHSEYVIIIVFRQQQRLHESASMLRFCVHCLSCLTLSLVTRKQSICPKVLGTFFDDLTLRAYGMIRDELYDSMKSSGHEKLGCVCCVLKVL